MATQDKLEIIRRNGEIEFYTLEPGGITNIGRHPENDIVITSPGVAPFHAVIEHRQKPYHVVVLSHNGQTTLGGQPLSPNVATPLGNWDSLEIDGHTLILIEGSGNGVGPSTATYSQARPERSTTPTTPYPVAPPIVPPPTRPEEPVSPSALGPPRFLTSSPGDMADEAILTEFETRERTIETGQSATYSITVINGGPIVATFVVNVVGLDLEWVMISPTYVNLYEGERTSITVTVTPPRLPTSLAGSHPFAIIVTSPNYPRRYSQREATLTINPYYEFAVSELDPKQQTISWFRRSGEARVTIHNKGNSNTYFRLEGANDERACSFEFQVPGETVGLAQQAELSLKPEEKVSIPVRIAPYSRRLVGLRKRTYAYTITSTTIAAQQTPRSLLGQLSQKPLLGFWILSLLTLLLVLLLVWIISPRLYMFMLTDGGTTATVRNSTPVALQWESSLFTTDLRIEPPIEGLEQPIPPRGTVVAAPTKNTTYYLIGNNLLSRFVPILAPPTRVIEVNVNPIAPKIVFKADPGQVVGAGDVTLSWQVEYADKIELFRKVGNSDAQELISDVSDQLSGSLKVTPEPNQSTTTYILVASNNYAPTATPVPQLVTLLTPTPTAPPTPAVVFFAANPGTINEGERSALAWQVVGVQQVTIQGIPGGSIYPAQGNAAVQPTGSADYSLIVPGAPPQFAHIEVIPATPTPTATPPPTAPEIKFFTADPAEFVKGEESGVLLTWSVVGTTTNVEISGPTLASPLSNLANDGTINVAVDKTTQFVLTAFNKEAKVSKTVEIKVTEPTPTVPPPPPPTPLPPKPIISFFKADPSPSNGSPTDVTFVGGDPPVYKVVAGKDVQLSWDVKNADKVTLIGQGDQSAQGNKILPSVTVNNTYQLKATNGGGDTDAFLRLEVIPPPAPPPPFDVFGTESAGVNTITWKYDPNFRSQIVGFRVVNSTDPPDLPLVDESTLTGSAFSWPHSITPTCGRGYYVVAVYIDIITGQRVTLSSTNSWYSTPCP